MKEFTSHSEDDTIAIAQEIAGGLKPSQILLLEGTLGAGKSVFARALIRKLAGNPDLVVPSPTFTLLQTYDLTERTIWHYDLYRLKDPEEMNELSWDDALSSGIVLIEWPEKLDYLKPAGTTIRIETVANADNSRKITIDEN